MQQCVWIYRRGGDVYEVVKKEVIEVAGETEEVVEVRKPKVGKLELDFGREDLNRLRDKLNELAELS